MLSVHHRGSRHLPLRNQAGYTGVGADIGADITDMAGLQYVTYVMPSESLFYLPMLCYFADGLYSAPTHVTIFNLMIVVINRII